MVEYNAPIRDMEFVLREVVGIERLSTAKAFADIELNIIPDLLLEADRFFGKVIAPTNRAGDMAGAVRNDDGSVTSPEGFREAYQQYVAGGWGAIPFSPEYGGGGFPWLVGIAVTEMLTASNMAFSLSPMLTQGSIHAIQAHGQESDKQRWLPKLITGQWAGTMNMTEPQAGSDVGALTTKAVKQQDGSYLITGQKIFITWGEHDMAENIVHLVLARTPEAPAGTQGISLFVVPKFLVNNDGGIGEANDIKCVSIEHKLGIHASPTCVLQFGDTIGSTGYIIGEENAGMSAMFTMMNQARLAVGLEGLAVGDRAYQAALTYATERQQGQRLHGEKGLSATIIEHPDVRRMLMTMKAYLEALRCLIYFNAFNVDLAEHSPNEEERRLGQELADLLTPISKAWGTDLGNEITSLAMQVHGGMGYIEETGVAQHYRDIRVGAIYEGTNGIQAIDLVSRKLPMRNGGAVNDLIAEIGATVKDLQEAGLTEVADRVEAAAADLLAAGRWLLEKGAGESDDGLAGATPYLRMFGLTIGGWLLAKSALIAHRLLIENSDSDSFLKAKTVTAHFYATQLLPQVHGLLPSVTAGATDLYSITPEAFR